MESTAEEVVLTVTGSNAGENIPATDATVYHSPPANKWRTQRTMALEDLHR